MSSTTITISMKDSIGCDKSNCESIYHLSICNIFISHVVALSTLIIGQDPGQDSLYNLIVRVILVFRY